MAVTIQCVPAFNLHAGETVEPLDDVLADIEPVRVEPRSHGVLLDAGLHGLLDTSDAAGRRD